MPVYSDPDPNQVALGGLHPGVSSAYLSRRQWPTAFLLGKARCSRSIRWHHLAGRPQAGSYRPAPTAGQVPLAGEAPWPLYVSAVNSYILCSSTRSEDGRVIDMKTGLLVGFRTDPSCPARQALFGKATRRERVWVGRSIRSLIRSRSGLVHKLGKD